MPAGVSGGVERERNRQLCVKEVACGSARGLRAGAVASSSGAGAVVIFSADRSVALRSSGCAVVLGGAAARGRTPVRCSQRGCARKSVCW